MAVQIAAPGVIEHVDLDVGPPGPGEALVRVAYAGICGSDRELLEGGRPAGFVRELVEDPAAAMKSAGCVGPTVRFRASRVWR